VVNSPPWGYLTKFFFLTPSGLKFLKRHRLKSRALRALRKGIHAAKRDVEGWIIHYWARDTGRLAKSIIKFLNRNVYNNLSTAFKVAIGSDVEYHQYVLRMEGVNWTNPNTRAIEGNMESSLVERIEKSLRQYIPDALDAEGLGWMVGRGRLPNQITISYASGYKKVVPRYRGRSRILQWA